MDAMTLTPEQFRIVELGKDSDAREMIFRDVPGPEPITFSVSTSEEPRNVQYSAYGQTVSSPLYVKAMTFCYPNDDMGEATVGSVEIKVCCSENDSWRLPACSFPDKWIAEISSAKNELHIHAPAKRMQDSFKATFSFTSAATNSDLELKIDVKTRPRDSIGDLDIGP